MNSPKLILPALTLAALLGGCVGTIGNANDHQDGTVYDEPQPYHRRARRSYTRVEEVPPPPPAQPAPPDVAEKITPSPAAEAVWIPGYWDFNGNAYAWTPGHWEIPPPNSRSYVASHWEVRANTNVFVRGHWQ